MQSEFPIPRIREVALDLLAFVALAAAVALATAVALVISVLVLAGRAEAAAPEPGMLVPKSLFSGRRADA